MEVNAMFRDAMLASGVVEARARFLFNAVEQLGPSWQVKSVDPRCVGPDGRPDFSKCTQNSGTERQVELSWPPVGPAELSRFEKEFGAEATPEQRIALQRSIRGADDNGVDKICLNNNSCTPVRILFGTTRNSVNRGQRLGFNERRAQGMSLGSAVVTVPRVERKKLNRRITRGPGCKSHRVTIRRNRWE